MIVACCAKTEYFLIFWHKFLNRKLAFLYQREHVSAKWFNSRTYGLMAIPLGVLGLLSISVSQLYFSADSLFSLPLFVLGLFLVVVSVVLLFFFFTMQ
jgi:hypothetical protein